ncbi:Crp/Fnr family transcriptional regulator [Herpetosiphon gulosus]|uniref:HTH crp-type domain-containing protein n=1 Tax=Herpetosiphon gulosus TaxID=1973496 RepID=A0ABP9X977_9CHLR
MLKLLLISSDLPDQALLGQLLDAGYRLSLVRLGQVAKQAIVVDQSLLLGSFANDHELAQLTENLSGQELIWWGWNQSSYPHLTLKAYEAGARHVISNDTSPSQIIQQLNALQTSQLNQHNTRGREQHYPRGAMVHLQADQALLIETGILSLQVNHPDGAQVLLGLFGPNQLVCGHPHDGCAIYLQAHTPISAQLLPWQRVLSEPLLIERLRMRLQLMEAWASCQAHPYLDQRVLGILNLLAEQFGKQHNHGLLIDVRITHEQLASAVGSTRATISRIIRDLRTRSILDSHFSGSNERFWLPIVPQYHHTHPFT